jgi:hypothetical protein
LPVEHRYGTGLTLWRIVRQLFKTMMSQSGTDKLVACKN